MKLLVDIPEHIYEHAKETTEDSRDEFDAMRAIANGTQQKSRSEIPNTCGDAISRQAVLDLMRGLTRWCVRSEDGKWKNVGLLYDDVMFGIDRLPSVTPQQRKTQMLDESNFDVNQYEMDLQSAYDCGRASTQQRTGRWIEVIDETDSLGNKTWHHECSICGSDKSGWGTYKHCPDCGTKMESEDKE